MFTTFLLLPPCVSSDLRDNDICMRLRIDLYPFKCAVVLMQ